MAPLDGTPAPSMGNARNGDVVEIPLLLPTSWAEGLVDLSRRRNQSVGQILRGLIDQALLNDAAERS